MARPGQPLRLRGKTYILRFQYSDQMRLSCLYHQHYDPGSSKEISLETEDYELAQYRACPHLRRHAKIRCLTAADRDQKRAWGTKITKHKREPGTTQRLEDGTVLINRDNEQIRVSPDAPSDEPPAILRLSPSIMIEMNDYGRRQPEYLELQAAEQAMRARYKPRTDLDAKVVDNYLALGTIKDKNDQNALRDTLALWKQLCPGKTFVTGEKADARKVVDHLQKVVGHRVGTLKKRISYIKAAINWEMNENDKSSPIKSNIFAKIKIAPLPGETRKTKVPYSEDHIRRIKAHKDRFTDQQYLMIALHIATSVRPEALFNGVARLALDTAEDEHGVVHKTWFIEIVADKNPYGVRSIPIPQAILDLEKKDGTPALTLPHTGRLFDHHDCGVFLNGINQKLKRYGINDAPGMTLYSGRHRASDNMLNRGVSDKHAAAIKGHARTEYGSAAKYGHGFAMWVLKPIIDKIGF